jgi:hypothetical protein
MGASRSVSRRTTSTTAGMLATRGWLTARGLPPSQTPLWHAEIVLDIADQFAREQFDERVDTRCRIEIYADEWGVQLCHGGRSSKIRVTDVAFVEGRDDFQLIDSLPPLRDLGQLLRKVEARNDIQFRRRNAAIQTNLLTADAAIRAWIESL